MTERFPSDATARLVVRCGDDLRDRMNALAKLNGRSANTEAIKALEAWLDQADHAQQTAHEVANDLPEPTQRLGTIYVAMDSKGPTCWREVMKVVGAINEAGGFDVVDQRVSMVTPEHVANDKRKAEIAALTERLRALSANGWVED